MSVASPCVKVCRMEGAFCVGCLRTLDEIARWSTASDSEKTAVLAAIEARRSAAQDASAPNRG